MSNPVLFATFGLTSEITGRTQLHAEVVVRPSMVVISLALKYLSRALSWR
jgi:hypothetical protein